MTPTGIYQSISDEAYHADRGSLSSTGARLLLSPSCPAKFRQYLDGPKQYKKVWDFGHIAHHLTLGKGTEFVVLDPAVHGLKKDGTVADNPAATSMWRDEVAKARKRGAVPVSKADYELADAIAKAVHAHPIAGPLFVDGSPEVSMYADDPVTGVQLRARADWITGDSYDPNRVWLVDLKTSTTSEPEEFSRKAAGLKYHIQAAFYLRVARLLRLDAKAEPRFLFVAVEKDPPHLVTVGEFSDEQDQAEADRLVRQAIDTYHRCSQENDWPSYVGTDAIVPFKLPRWATRAGIQADADQLISELEGIYL